MKADLFTDPRFPGLLLTAAVAGGAFSVEWVEQAVGGRSWLGPLVWAILLGTAVRTFWRPSERFDSGIDCAARTLLELAIVLMGASLSANAMAAIEMPLLLAIVTTVAAAIAMSFAIGCLLGLPPKMAMLVACGNAICGNSAIAAVAPVIKADSEDVATSIAFTAVLGIGVVIALPLLATILSLTPVSAGILAGLTVYAVPQVVAAAGSLGSAAVQVGTLVKLARVLMLGPVVAILSLVMAKRKPGEAASMGRRQLLHLVPPFILAFLVLAALNALALVPAQLHQPAHHASNVLTVIAMAGLGLGVDLRSVAAAGPRVVTVVAASLFLLGMMAYVAIHLLSLS